MPDNVDVVPLERTDAWQAYVAGPSGPTLQGLLGTAAGYGRNAVVLAMEDHFFASSNWRVAQHLAMIHAGTLLPEPDAADEMRAFFFAHRACELSGDDPRARSAAARIHWERRLPLAVLHDVEVILKGIPQIAAELGDFRRRRLQAEALTFAGMARAYLRDVDGALDSLVEAETLVGFYSIEAAVQLLFASDTPDVRVCAWLAMRIPANVGLGGRGVARLLRVHRILLVSTLRAKVASPS